MSELTDLQVKLQDTVEAISRLERTMADHVDDPAILANMRSLQKRQDTLEKRFRVAADELGADICSYRLFPNGSQPTLPGFVTALGDFQSLFSIVYGAIREGPKATAHLGEAALRESTFNFAYSFPGSVGVALTIPNDRLLFEEAASDLDSAMETIFRMAKSETSDDLRGFTHRLGRGPIRALYKWADDHVKENLGAAIEWRRRDKTRGDVFVQRPELERLRNAIDATSDRESVEREVEGDLVGADVQTRSFRMRVGDSEIRGTFTDAISPEHTVELPRPYRALIRVTKRIYYATEKEEVDNVLLRLDPLPPRK